VSEVCSRVRRGARLGGGVIGYPLNALYQEVAFVAYYFHWGRDEIFNFEHVERRRWVQEISTINQRMEAEQTNAA